MADHVGQRFGEYRLICKLGEGYFGVVYLGEHIPDKTQAAVKVFKTRLTTNLLKDFLKEARNIRLQHPHIVKILDFDAEGDTPFIVMDYAANGSLRQHHNRGTQLPLTTIVSYVKQLADALQYVHDQKVVHRDLKPENILLGQNNEILLGDFGIATITSTYIAEQPQNVAGTIAYMAPEQIQAHPSRASDQYALGIIVYEWLSGDVPFQGTLTEVAIKHATVPPPPLREKLPMISPAVEAVVMKALAKDPKQRFASVREFANALEQASFSHSMISLFGYETDGGRKSVLWDNPHAFSPNENFQAWYEAKRSFTKEEILDGTWIKLGDHGYSLTVHFLDNGNLNERFLFDSNRQWHGSWQLIEGMLRMNVNINAAYELDIFANREGSMHSGIEFVNYQKDPLAYFAVLHIHSSDAKHWDVNAVPDLINRMYDQVLNRPPDPSGLLTYGSLLLRGERSMRDIMKILGLSQEYKEHFIDTKTIDEAIGLCYEHFLGRKADDGGKAYYSQLARTTGVGAILVDLIDSDEYEKNFGEDAVPPKVQCNEASLPLVGLSLHTSVWIAP